MGSGVVDLDLQGKVALITGSSRGIGRAIAETLAAEGCSIMLTGRDGSALHETVRAIEAAGGTAKSHLAELRDAAAPAMLVDSVKREFSRLDILVSNAG